MERDAAYERVGAHKRSNFCIGVAIEFRNRCELSLLGFIYYVGERGGNLHGRAKNIRKLDLLARYRFRIDLFIYRSGALFHILAVRYLYRHYFLWLVCVE